MRQPQRLSPGRGVHPQANGGHGNERYTNVGRYAYQDIVWSSRENLEKFIRELHGVASHVNTTPNALGRHDKHRISFGHKQLHPSMIGIVDLLYSPKEVGQSGMISPWADLSGMNDTDVNKYPNIKYDLFNFIQQEFGSDVTFDCDSIEEYNDILDRLVMKTYDLFNIHYTIPPELIEDDK